MRADDHAFIALDAERGIPDRDFQGEIAFFPLARSCWPDPIGGEGAHRQLVAASGQEGSGDSSHKLRSLNRNREWPRPSRSDGFGNNDLLDPGDRLIHGVPVPLDQVGAFAGITFLDRTFDFRDCLIKRKDIAQRKVGDLHDRVDAGAHAGFLRDAVGVDDEKFQRLRDNEFLRLMGEVVPCGVRAVRRVEKEDRSLPRRFKNRLLFEQVVLVASDEIRGGDQIRGANRIFSKPQMRNRDGSRLLRVVNKIRLGMEAEFLGNDLDRILVRTHRAVGAKAEEDRLVECLAGEVELRIIAEREPADVVLDADREFLAGDLRLHIREDRRRHGRSEFFRRKAKPATADRRQFVEARTSLGAQCRRHIQKERLARRTRLFGSVQNSDVLHREWKRVQKCCGVKRPVEPDLKNSGFLAGAVQIP